MSNQSFEMNEIVHITRKDIIGSIIDITTGKNGETVYVVESMENVPVNDPDAYPGEWPQFDCVAEDLEKVHY